MSNLINEAPDHVFNFFCLVVKQWLYVNRCFSNPINLFEIEKQIEKFRIYELYYAKKVNKLHLHIRKWKTNINVNRTGFG